MFPATRLFTIVRVICAQLRFAISTGLHKSTKNPAFMQDRQDCRRPNVWGGEAWRKRASPRKANRRAWGVTAQDPTICRTAISISYGFVRSLPRISNDISCRNNVCKSSMRHWTLLPSLGDRRCGRSVKEEASFHSTCVHSSRISLDLGRDAGPSAICCCTPYHHLSCEWDEWNLVLLRDGRFLRPSQC